MAKVYREEKKKGLKTELENQGNPTVEENKGQTRQTPVKQTKKKGKFRRGGKERIKR